MKQSKKGFTLVELMIVIVIIGILAAIIIPTVTDAIERSKIAKLQTEVKNMNTQLIVESLFDNVGCYTPAEVQKIISEAGLKLNETPKGYSLWYNQSTNQVEFKKNDEVFVTGSALLPETYADSAKRPVRIEAFTSNKDLLYIDESDIAINSFILNMRNLVNDAENATDFLKEIENLTNNHLGVLRDAVSANISATITKHITDFFSTSKTLFVSESKMATGATETISNVLFASNMYKIDGNLGSADKTIKSEVIIEIPNTVSSIAQDAFSKFTDTEFQVPASAMQSINDTAATFGTNANVSIVSSDYSAIDFGSGKYENAVGFEYTYAEYKKKDGTVVLKDKNNGETLISGNDASEYFTQYCIPTLKLNADSSKLDFSKIESFVIRRVNYGYLTKIVAVAVVNEGGNLKGYRFDNYGYITNVKCRTTDSYIYTVKKDNNTLSLDGQAENSTNYGGTENPSFTIELPEGTEKLVNYQGAKVVVNYDIYLNTYTKSQGAAIKYYEKTGESSKISKSLYKNYDIKNEQLILIDINSLLPNNITSNFVSFSIKINSIKIVKPANTTEDSSTEALNCDIQGTILFIRYFN